MTTRLPIAKKFPGELDFIKRGMDVDAFSSIQCLHFFGPLYTSQVREVTGYDTIGDVVAFFSQFNDLKTIIGHVHLCCKNKRGGQRCLKTGQCFDLFHHGAAVSLFQLFLFARQNHEEYFLPTHPHSLIQIRSAELHKVIRAEQATAGGTDERRQASSKKKQSSKPSSKPFSKKTAL